MFRKEVFKMNNIQENKYSMYLTVAKVIDKFKTTWLGFPAFVAVVLKCKNVMDRIEQELEKQRRYIVGIAVDKNVLKGKIADLANIIAFSLKSYAFSVNNNELAQEMNVKKYILLRTRDSELVSFCNNITSKATELIASQPAAMTNFQINNALVTSLTTLVTEYLTLIQNPREAITTRSAATKRLKQLFKEGDNLLNNELDGLMLRYKTSNPDFYDKYVKARLVVDIGIRHEKEEDKNPS